jgi:hypothetical protein
MLAIGWLLFGGALSLLASLRAMLDDLSPHHPLLKAGNRLHQADADDAEKGGVVAHLPLPPYLRPTHAAAALLDAADANPAAAGPRRRWNAHQALWEIHMVRGNAWLAERFDIGRHGRSLLLETTSYLFLFTSVYFVLVLEQALSGTHHWLVFANAVPFALTVFVAMPSVVYYSAFVANIEMLRGQEAVDVVRREMKLKQGLRVLKVLHQLRSFGERQDKRQEKRASAKLKKPPPLVRAVSSMVEASLRGSTHADDAAKAYVSDALRVTEWHEIFSLMDLAEATDAKAEKAAFNHAFAEVVAADDPSAAWVREEEYSGMGGDGTLSLLELAFFLHKQRCLPEFFVPAASLAAVVDDPADADDNTRAAFRRAYDLFRRIKARCGAEEVAAGGGAAGYAAVPEEELRSGLTFQEFFGVMVEDEHRLEKGGEEELARAIFGMVDAVVCVGDDDEAADAADVEESAPPPRAPPVAAPPPARATAASARLSLPKALTIPRQAAATARPRCSRAKSSRAASTACPASPPTRSTTSSSCSRSTATARSTSTPSSPCARSSRS